jgi:diphthamide synthase (EF-2-diphthine--ammonia ligase)
VVRQRGEAEVVGLLTTVTEPFGRVSMHGVREDVLRAQAEAAGLPLCRVPIPAPCPNEVYADAMRKALEAARQERVTQMIFGDLFLEDVRAYRERMLDGTGITAEFPLWGRPTRELAEEMIAAGLVAHVTCLDPRRISRRLAGRRFDLDLLSQLPADVDPCAERGEFHTCVSAGPMFRRPVAVVVGQSVERDGFVFADLTLARQNGEERTGGQAGPLRPTAQPDLT